MFKAAYTRLVDPWVARFGWPLFRPLHKDDEHCFDRLNRLIDGEQSDFDDQVKNLTKLLVDPLNEKAIQEQLPTKKENEQGIDKLERWFTEIGQPNAKSNIQVLRDLQAIRSRGVAHSKGGGYEKLWKKLGYEGRSLSEVLDELLGRATEMLDDFRAWAEGSKPNEEG